MHGAGSLCGFRTSRPCRWRLPDSGAQHNMSNLNHCRCGTLCDGACNRSFMAQRCSRCTDSEPGSTASAWRVPFRVCRPLAQLCQSVASCCWAPPRAQFVSYVDKGFRPCRSAHCVWCCGSVSISSKVRRWVMQGVQRRPDSSLVKALLTGKKRRNTTRAEQPCRHGKSF